MGDLFIIFPISAIVSFIVVPGLLKNKKKKEAILYFFFLSFGLGLMVLLAFGVELPSPAKVIVFLSKPGTEWILKFFN